MNNFQTTRHSTNSKIKFRNLNNCKLTLRILGYLAERTVATRKEILVACNDPSRCYDIENSNHEIITDMWDAGLVAPACKGKHGVYYYGLTARGRREVELRKTQTSMKNFRNA